MHFCYFYHILYNLFLWLSMLPSRTFCFSLWVRSGLIFTGQRVIQTSSQVARQFTGFAQEGERWSRDPTIKTCSKKLSNFLDHFQQALLETKQTHHKFFVKVCEDVKTCKNVCQSNNAMFSKHKHSDVLGVTGECVGNKHILLSPASIMDVSKCVSHWY